MFCPTAVDAYFGKKLSHLDLTFSKTSSYQERVSFEERVKEAEDTRSRYPNKIPLVIEKHKADKYLQDIDKVATIRPFQLYFLGFSHDRPTLLTYLCVCQIKWLVPHEMTLLQLAGVIKQRIRCPPHQQIFLTVQNR